MLCYREAKLPVRVLTGIERGPALAYTTVLTVLNRLHDKGLVACEKDDRHAAAQLQDATCVAMAFVSVERMRTASRASAAAEPALGVAAGTDLGARVRALLDDIV